MFEYQTAKIKLVNNIFFSSSKHFQFYKLSLEKKELWKEIVHLTFLLALQNANLQTITDIRQDVSEPF